ncbi:MAG: hypothetical protein SF069_17075 [Phycisphaerae bacterium]|nr:hypothetical protein [Phycisphaerae bacterium]
MKSSLRALLTNAIDYAGLFPPAKLPMEPAIRNYAAYRQCDDAWMLGPFVVPAAQLNEVSRFADDLFNVSPPFRFSVLMGGGDDDHEFEGKLAADVALASEFVRRHGQSVLVDAVELRLPERLSKDAPQSGLEAGGRLDRSLRTAIEAFPRAAWFCEIPPGAAWDAALAPVTAWLARTRDASTRCGFKLRTGGLTPDAFPSSDRIARALLACRENGLAIKFTAGLHHPIRALRAEVRTHMHGFINVFVAGVLAHAFAVDPLRVEELVAVLESENPRDFEFQEETLAFRHQSAALADIRDIRARDVISFGSCSFDEPRDDLRALEWL